MGPVETACTGVAESYCCGVDDDVARADCLRSVKYQACQLIGSAPEAGCMNGGPCIRSSVDFAACQSKFDVAGDVCRESCATTGGVTPCFQLPAECVSPPCPTLTSGCVEDTEPWSSSP